MDTLNRAYALLYVKAVDTDRRLISGTATTPEPDRLEDVIEPLGVSYRNPLPLLLYHDAQRPVGTVTFHKPTATGITFDATIPNIDQPGTLKDRCDEAWQSVKAGLLKGVSIGFRALERASIQNGGIRFLKTEVLELSLVSVPANMGCTIAIIKSYDARPAASGTGPVVVKSLSPGATGSPQKDRTMKTLVEQISSFEATRQAKSASMAAIMEAAGEKGETLDAAQSEQYDGLAAEVKSIDQHLVRLRDMEDLNRKAAKPVSGTDPASASDSRGGSPIIRVRDNIEPGIAFARAVMCKIHAQLDHLNVMDVAKARYPDHAALHGFLLKAAVPGGTTTETTWAKPLVNYTNLAAEFIEFLRPQTIIGKFGTGGIPSLTRVPFNVRIPSQTVGGDGYWVGQGAPKPLTAFGYSYVSLGYTKVAAISVITKELARFSTPSAETLVRNQLTAALIDRIDTDFVDPGHAVAANVSPASITNGLVALTSAGTSAANVITDLTAIIGAFVEGHYNATSLVLIMPNTLALALSLMTNSLGQPEFPAMTVNGGTLKGIPVITSQYAANVSGGGNLVIAVSAKDIFLADDGNVTVDSSDQASLQMLDNPTNSAASGTATTMVSMYQTNSIALRAEREICWAKGRSDCVVYMDDVNWGSVGSPS